MIGYVKHFDSNKTMSFRVFDNKLLKNYTKIWERVSKLMDIESDSSPVYSGNDKYIKTKIKSYGDMKKEVASNKCLSMIILDSVIRGSKKYYPQKIKKNKIENLINNDLGSSLSDESANESDNKIDNKAKNRFDNESDD